MIKKKNKDKTKLNCNVLSTVQESRMRVCIPVQCRTFMYSVCQYTRSVLFSNVQCMSVETYSIVQYFTVQVSRNVQWCTVMHSIYQCPVQCGTVFVQCKSVEYSTCSGMSVLFETSSVTACHDLLNLRTKKSPQTPPRIWFSEVKN